MIVAHRGVEKKEKEMHNRKQNRATDYMIYRLIDRAIIPSGLVYTQKEHALRTYDEHHVCITVRK